MYLILSTCSSFMTCIWFPKHSPVFSTMEQHCSFRPKSLHLTVYWKDPTTSTSPTGNTTTAYPLPYCPFVSPTHTILQIPTCPWRCRDVRRLAARIARCALRTTIVSSVCCVSDCTFTGGFFSSLNHSY